MATNVMKDALLETLRKATLDGEVDVMHEGLGILVQAIMAMGVGELKCVARWEPDPERRLTDRWHPRIAFHPHFRVLDEPSRDPARHPHP